MEIGI